MKSTREEAKRQKEANDNKSLKPLVVVQWSMQAMMLDVTNTSIRIKKF